MIKDSHLRASLNSGFQVNVGRVISGRHRRGRTRRKPFPGLPLPSKAPPRNLGSGADRKRTGFGPGPDHLRRELHRLLYTGRWGEGKEGLPHQPSGPGCSRGCHQWNSGLDL